MARRTRKSGADLTTKPVANRYAEGLGAMALVNTYKPDIHSYWYRALKKRWTELAGIQGMQASALAAASSVDASHDPQILRNAINITQARNQAGLGRILQDAQSTVQVLQNDRTSELAYVIGPDVLERVFEGQIEALQSRIEELQMELDARSDSLRAQDATDGFFKLRDSFEPIQADIQIVEGTPPAPAVEI